MRSEVSHQECTRLLRKGIEVISPKQDNPADHCLLLSKRLQLSNQGRSSSTPRSICSNHILMKSAYKISKWRKMCTSSAAWRVIPPLVLFEVSFESFCSYFRTNKMIIFILGVGLFMLLKLNPGKFWTELSLQTVKVNTLRFKHIKTKHYNLFNPQSSLLKVNGAHSYILKWFCIFKMNVQVICLIQGDFSNTVFARKFFSSS